MLRRSQKFLSLLILLSCAFWLVISAQPARASLLANRSLQLSTSQPSAAASHTFQFDFVSTGSVGSIVFEYCDSPVFGYVCTAPTGLDVSSANLSSQSGNVGFIFDGVNSTNNKIVLTRAPVASAAVASSYTFNNITNPSTPSYSEYVRISTYASIDGSGSFTDNGAVAFATQPAFSVSAAVPPFLQLCVAVNVASDCSSMSGNSINLGNLANTVTRSGTSQLSIGTNSPTGHILYVLGTTMTSGNNSIPALAAPTTSIIGNNQFGINLRNNSIPNVGANPSGPGSTSPTADYNSPNLYKYSNGDSIATSALPTNYNRITVSYVVNVKKTQPPGVYSSTFTYLATASF